MTNMSEFSGFPDENKARLTPVPAQFFRELLSSIDHLGEMKVTLYIIWKFDRMETDIRYITRHELREDESFMRGLGKSFTQAERLLDESLERAVGRGTLLCVEIPQQERDQDIYFLNSPRGRAALTAFKNGDWKPSQQSIPANHLDDERPNIFRLYEENIGPLTPLISDMLKDSEALYPQEWLEEAIRISVQNNVRNWRYVEAVLKRWKEEGRSEQDRRDIEKNRRRYTEGEYADFIEH